MNLIQQNQSWIDYIIAQTIDQAHADRKVNIKDYVSQDTKSHIILAYNIYPKPFEVGFGRHNLVERLTNSSVVELMQIAPDLPVRSISNYNYLIRYRPNRNKDQKYWNVELKDMTVSKLYELVYFNDHKEVIIARSTDVVNIVTETQYHVRGRYSKNFIDAHINVQIWGTTNSHNLFYTWLKDAQPGSKWWVLRTRKANIVVRIVDKIRQYECVENEMDLEVPKLKHKYVHINGICFKSSDLRLFYNTHFYDLLVNTQVGEIELHLMSLDDLKLMKDMLAGRISFLYFYTNISDYTFAQLMAEHSLIDLFELLQARWFMLKDYSIGLPFKIQMSKIEVGEKLGKIGRLEELIGVARG